MEIISMISQSLKSVSMKSVSMAGKTDGEWFEGYPLEVLAKAKKTASAYTIFGNTNASAKGVGTEIKQYVNLAQQSTQTVNGVTFTPKADGTIAVNGTATALAKYSVARFNVNNAKWLWCGTPNGGSTASYYMGTSVSFADTGNGSTRDFAGDTALYVIYIYIAEGYTANNLVFRPQLFDLTEMGMTAVTNTTALCSALGVSSLPYLPFGSTYHIGVVDGSKNLFDKDTAAVGYLAADGSVLPPDHENLTSDFIPVTEGEIYTYSLFGNKSITLSFWTGGCFYDANKALIGTRIVRGTASFSLTVPSGAKYIRIGSRELSTLLNAQLERGATATAYSPYFSAKKSALFLPCPLYLNETMTDKGKITKADGTTATAVSVGKIGVQKGDNVITTDTEVKPTKIKAKI